MTVRLHPRSGGELWLTCPSTLSKKALGTLSVAIGKDIGSRCLQPSLQSLIRKSVGGIASPTENR